MSLFQKKNTNNAVRLEPSHKKPGFQAQCMEFWLTNHNLIVLTVLTIFILVLVFMVGYAFAMHFHGMSTEANNYEHLTEIVTCYGVKL